MKVLEQMLQKEIQEELNILQDVELGSETYNRTVDNIAKLTDRIIELKKIEADSLDKEAERNLKTEQFAEDKKDRIIKNSIAASGIVLPVVVTVWGTLKSFKFEENGTITTTLGRGFLNKLLPKK